MSGKTFHDFESAKIYAKKIAMQYKIYVDLRKIGTIWHVNFTLKSDIKETQMRGQRLINKNKKVFLKTKNITKDTYRRNYQVVEETRKALNEDLDEKKKVYEKLNIEELKSILKADSELSDYEKTIIRLIIQKNSGVINPYF